MLNLYLEIGDLQLLVKAMVVYTVFPDVIGTTDARHIRPTTVKAMHLMFDFKQRHHKGCINRT